MPSSTVSGDRELRVRTKSRKGCRNCKLRKVKCDEGRPQCSKCIQFRVLCNYFPKGTGHYGLNDLQLSAIGVSQIDLSSSPSVSVPQPIQYNLPPTLRIQTITGIEVPTPFQCDNEDYTLLRKFQRQTVYVITTEKTLDLYQKHMLRLACVHPYLLHSILTLTMMHERSLARSTIPLTSKEAFHWCRGLRLFNAKLYGKVQPSERDPLWAAAMALGIISFYYHEGSSPFEAWPLKAPSAMDLNWLKMVDGKKAVFEVAGRPTEPALFEQPYPKNISSLLPPLAAGQFDNLGDELVELFELRTSSTKENNHYISAALLLSRACSSNDVLAIIISFLTFIGDMTPGYRDLLFRKDPRALLLLAYWYAKVCNLDIWWITRRAILEGSAICIYLERFESSRADLIHLLQYPKAVFDSAR